MQVPSVSNIKLKQLLTEGAFSNNNSVINNGKKKERPTNQDR